MNRRECTAQRFLMAGVQVDGARLDDSGNLMSSGTITEAASLQPIWTRNQTHGKTRNDTRHPRRHLRLYSFANGLDHWLGISPTREHIRPAEILRSEPRASLPNNRASPLPRVCSPWRSCTTSGPSSPYNRTTPPRNSPSGVVPTSPSHTRCPTLKKRQASRPDRVLTPYAEHTCPLATRY